VVAPALLAAGEFAVLDVWVHREQQRQEMLRRAREAQGRTDIHVRTGGTVKVAQGNVITIKFSLPDFDLADPLNHFEWVGQINNATFGFAVPADAHPGAHPGILVFYLEGVPIARLDFTLRVDRQPDSSLSLPEVREHRIRSAFASYARADTKDVVARIQGIKKILPELDVFLDVLSLRSGEHWKDRLSREIMERDRFFLFWSLAASQSIWVKREWRTALRARGLDYIDPVPLVSPDEVPPPPALSKLHFDDSYLFALHGKEARA
jgi:hypothetical protein